MARNPFKAKKLRYKDFKPKPEMAKIKTQSFSDKIKEVVGSKLSGNVHVVKISDDISKISPRKVEGIKGVGIKNITTITNPFIADNFFLQHPEKVLGEQTMEKGRYGSEFVKVKGSIDNLQQIDVPFLNAEQKFPNANLSAVSQESIIKKVMENEKENLIDKKLKPKKKAETPASANQVASISNQQVYSIRETSEMYNTNISRAEMEAYFYTHPEFDYKLYFDEYENGFLRQEGLIMPVVIGGNLKFEYVHTYKSGNISKRISDLNQHKEKIIEKYGQEQFDKQLSLLESVRPKQKGFVGDDKITLLPHSNFAREIRVGELRYGKPELNGDTTIFDAFTQWLREVPPDNFKKSNSREIIEYYLLNKSLPIDQKADKATRERQEKNAINIRQRTKEEGDELFGKFLVEELIPEDMAKIAYLWNEKYNSVVEPDLTKIPVGFRISKTFKNGMPFRLSATQRQAVAFIQEKQSGLLAYGVGVGKTAADIACISQAIDNGLAKKPLIVVPTNTYFKWIGEIQGYTDEETHVFYEGLLPHLPKVVGLYNLNADIVRNELKEYSADDKKILAKIERLIDALKDLDDADINNQKTRDKLSGIYNINWTGLNAAYAEMGDTKKSAIQFVIQYFNDEFRYKIYELGVIKSFPNGTIFVTTEQGIQKLGVGEDHKDALAARLYKILSQGETTDEKRAKEVAGLQLKIEQTVSSSMKKSKLLMEDFGFDFVSFDESHYYKKLFTYVKGAIKSVEEDDDGAKKYKRDKSKYELKSGAYPSSRALSAFVISHYIQSQNNNRNVIHLTATPFTNSPLEIYSMLVLTNYHALEKLGLDNMVDFFDTFMKINYDIKYTAQKTVVKDVVLTGFNNLPQMRQIIYSLIDKKDEGANLKRPEKWVLPSLEKGIQTTIPLSLDQTEIIRDIKEFIKGNTSYSALCAGAIEEEVNEIDFDSMSDDELAQTYNDSVHPDEDLILADDLGDKEREKLIAAIRKAKIGTAFEEADLTETESKGARILQALSAMRQVTLSPYTWQCRKSPELKKTLTYKKYIGSSPKLQYVMGCIKSVLDYHKQHNTKPSGQVMYMNAGVEYFPLIKEFLVKEIGLKESQVGLVSGGMSKGAKETVKRGFLNGDILVLIGSATISVGIDLQNNATVLYNCYYDWNPTDAQQVEGRIWRQGNRFSNVRIVYPMCYNSVDPVMFQYLQEKTSRINEIWNRNGQISELDLRDFDPKKLQQDLITDPEEKAQWEILEASEKVESQIIYFENRLESIQNAAYSINQLNEDREQVKELLNGVASARADAKRKEGIDAFKEKREAIIDKYSDDDAKLASELSKLKKSRYDYEKDPENKYQVESYSDKTDEQLYPEARRVIEWLEGLSYSDGDTLGDIYYNRSNTMKILARFRGNYKDYKQLVERVLIPLGLDTNNLSNPVSQVTEKVNVLRKELEAIEGSMAERVMKYKKEQENTKFNVTVQDRVNEFAAYNYLLDATLPQQIFEKKPIAEKLKYFLMLLEKSKIAA